MSANKMLFFSLIAALGIAIPVQAAEEAAEASATAQVTEETTPEAMAGSPETEASETAQPAAEAATPGDKEAFEADEQVIKAKKVVGKTATKMNIPLYQVPATVQVVSGETLKEQGVNEWTEALYNVPGVFTVNQGAGFVGASARGQNANSTLVLFDGVRDDSTQFAQTAPFTSLEDMERIEFLKGPSSVVYGQGAIGGALNFIRKKPSLKESYELNVKMGQYDTWRTHFGAQGPLPLGLAYRMDGAISRNGSFRNTSNRMSKFTLSLDAPLWSGANALLISTFNKDQFDNGGSVPTDAGAKWRQGAPRNRRYTTADAILYFEGYNVQLDVTQKFGENWKLSNVVSWLPVEYHSLSNGLTLATAPSTTITRTRGYFGTARMPFQDSVALNGEFEALGKHKVMASYDYQFYRQGQLRTTNGSTTGCSSCPPITTIDLFNPVETALPLPFLPNPSHQVYTEQTAHGAYVQEFYEPLPWLKALVGARFDSWERWQRQEKFVPGTRNVESAESITKTVTSAPTFRYGLILEPIRGYTLYASQSNSFKPTVVTTSWDGKLDWLPETGEMLELGQKVDLLGGRLSMGMAYFDIMKYNVLVNLGAHPSGTGSIFEQAGTQRSQGLEVDGSFATADGAWKLTGAYAYMYSSYYTFYSNTANFTGKRTTWSPINTVSLWATHKLPGGFGVSLGGRYMDEVFPANDNVVSLPAYWLANAALSYERGMQEFRVNVDNLMDRQDHYTSGGSTSLSPGAPRVITASFSQKF